MVIEQDIQEKVKAILLRLLDADEESVTPQAKLRADLGARSIDVVELITALENEFDIEIGDDDLRSGMTVQDVVDLVRAKSG